MRAAEADIGTEVTLEGSIPRVLQVAGCRPRVERGGWTDEGGGSHRHSEWNSRGRPEMEESTETSGGGRWVGATSRWKFVLLTV